MRDAKGEPTGALKEDAADDLVGTRMPAPTRRREVGGAARGMHEANQVGLVRVHQSGGISVEDGDFECLDLYDELRQQRRTDPAVLCALTSSIRRRSLQMRLQKIEDARRPLSR